MSALRYIVIGLLTLISYNLIIWLNKRREFYKKYNKFPGPKGLFILGNALDFQNAKDVVPRLMQYQKEHGLTYKVRLGVDPFIFTADAQIVESLTTSNTQINKNSSYRFAENWIGKGLVSARNPRWKDHRRLITPTFHFNILRDFLPTFHKNADNLVKHWKECFGAHKSKKTEVFHDVAACALDIICETAMGIEVNALREGSRSKYIQSVQFMGQTTMERTFSFWKQFDFLYNRSSMHEKELAMVSYIQKTTEDVIKRKRLQMMNSGHGAKIKIDDDIGTKKRSAFLDHLLASVADTGGFMSDEDLRDEINTFIFAGHDTTAATVSFFLYNIACNPDVQEKLYEEVSSVLGGDESMSYEKLSHLKYMDMVIKESMRMYPIVPIILRELSEDLKCNNGDVIPKGCNVGIFIYGSSRNADVFKNPEKFDPERFNSNNVGKYGAFAFIPFSAGPRNCIGQKFALVEVKSMLSTLIKEFKFIKPQGFDVQPVAEIVLKSSTGIHLFIEPRK